ncbi:MAG: YihY/virulence factor BrkB family protein [Treponema sp.]|jgi:membrane protein|nr:YihY/virulence factor BrkB family protein [Treponema sp.]
MKQNLAKQKAGLFIFCKTQIQRLVITLRFFGENGLGNHAAACAYGFLLSAAPALMLVSFFLFAAIHTLARDSEYALYHKAMEALAANIPFLGNILNETWFIQELPAISEKSSQFRGITGLVSGVSIFWAGRVFALSLQRGLKIIFTGTNRRNPLADTLATLLVEITVLICALFLIIFSQTARQIYQIFNLFPGAAFFFTALSHLNFQIVTLFIIGLIFYFVCRFLTANGPRPISSFLGSLFCVLSTAVLSQLLTMLLNQTRYNFLYGALGNLIVLLVNVYFFFMFFFLGAQLARILDSFDALLFLELRRARMPTARSGLIGRLFFSVEGRLKKYFHTYPGETTIFSRGDRGTEIYYLLEGEVEVYMSLDDSDEKPVILQQGVFFGEMGHILSEKRGATVRTKTAVSVLILPPALFDEMLRYDTALDKTIMEQLSRRLKNRNEQYTALFNR